MKVSVNWLKTFGVNESDIDHLVEKIGAQLGAVEEVIDWGSQYDGIVVVRVVSCEKHPDADKLSVCLVDDGKKIKNINRMSNGLIQVVCGAPNVRAGIFAAWLPPGATVPSSIPKDPFVLEARTIRGVVSNGMLSSLHELGISDDHSGILEIKPEDAGKDLVKPGTPFKKLYLQDDHIIDIENKMFTHRPDCFGQLGIAREIAGIYHKSFKSPEWYVRGKTSDINTSSAVKEVRVDNRIPKLCPRYIAVAIDDIEVKPSPVWLQSALARLGVRPINNVVDVTNWIMLMTGQPLHAFDFDKIANNGVANIVIRNPKKGEEMTLLDGRKILPRSSAILICNHDTPIALGGVMGGNNSEIDTTTKRIIIECANFDMYNIRKTSMEHGIFTDAVSRFNKGQSPEQCSTILDYTIRLIQQVSEKARVVSPIIDADTKSFHNPSVAVSAEFVNSRLGTKLSLREMTKLLENVEFKIQSVPADKTRLHVQAPFWRTDIHIPEDVVEEIGRLYGYDNINLQLPNRSLKPAKRNEIVDLKNDIRNVLSAAGANELLTYTFVDSNLLTSVGQNPENAFELSNALSPELQYYRLSLIPSLLTKVHFNLKSDRVRDDNNEFALFEINSVHAKGFIDDDSLPIEDQRLALVFAADDKTAKRKYAGAPYYAAVKYLDNLLEHLGITFVLHEALEYSPKEPISQSAIAPFDVKRAAIIKSVEGEFIGEIGEFSSSARRNLKLPSFSAGFELDVSQILKLKRPKSYHPISRFPRTSQDITLITPADVSYRKLLDCLRLTINEVANEDVQLTIGMPRIYQGNADTDHRNITLRIWAVSNKRTLKADEVNDILDSIADNAYAELGVTRG